MANYYSAYNPKEYEWTQLYYLMSSPVVLIDDFPNESEEIKGCIVLSSEFNQEKSLIRKDNFLKLSEEAKEIITTILNGPEEVLEIITTKKTGKFCKRFIKKFFKKNKKWNDKKTERVFFEIREYVNSL